MSHCTNCGKPLNLGKYCTACGSPHANPNKMGTEVSGWLVAIAVLVLLGATISLLGPTGEPSVIESGYVVDGTAGALASVTYRNVSGGTEQKTVTIPWTLTMAPRAGAFLYISAQKQESYGTVTVTVYSGGDKLQTAESNSAYGVASASGRAR